jgi:tetratricopeptide (TPR) repeat protein
LKQSIPHFERAIALRPDYAAAHAALSLAWSGLRGFGFIPKEAESRPTALKALQLDPNLADAHLAMGVVLVNDWEWARADPGMARALELNRDSIDACACYANLLARLGRIQEALMVIAHAEKVNLRVRQPILMARPGLISHWETRIEALNGVAGRRRTPGACNLCEHGSNVRRFAV